MCTTPIGCSLSRLVQDCPETLQPYNCSHGEAAGSQRDGYAPSNELDQVVPHNIRSGRSPGSATEIHGRGIIGAARIEFADSGRPVDDFVPSPLDTHHRERDQHTRGKGLSSRTVDPSWPAQTTTKSS